MFSLRRALNRAGWSATMENGKVCLSKSLTPKADYRIYLDPQDTKETYKAIMNYQFNDDDVEFNGDLFEYTQHLGFAESELKTLKQNLRKDLEEYKKAAAK